MKSEDSTALGAVVSVVLIMSIATVALATTLREVEEVCPLCGTDFRSRAVSSYSSFGVRLDLKPIGGVLAPLPVAVCPTCHFVLFKKEFSEQEVLRYRSIVYTPEYRQVVHKYPSYYMLGKLLELSDGQPRHIADAYLQASWQAECDSVKYQECLAKVAEHLGRCFGDSSVGRMWHGHPQVLYGEVLRLQRKTAEARSYFESLKQVDTFGKQPLRGYIEYELFLISENDCAPHTAPAIIGGQSSHTMCRTIMGYDSLAKIFKVEETGVGGYPYTVYAKLRSRRGGILRSAVWHSRLKRETPTNTWFDFLNGFTRVELRLAEYDWIKKWVTVDTAEREVEAWILGAVPNFVTEYNGDDIMGAWKCAYMKGKPVYEVHLRIGAQDYCTTYIGEKDDRALITYLDPHRPHDVRHWLDSPELYTSMSSCILVDEKGKWKMVSYTDDPCFLPCIL